MIKKIQFIFLVFKAFIIRHQKYITFGWLLGFLLTIFIFQTYPIYSSFFSSKTMKIGLASNISEDNLPLFIQNQISLGLTSLTSEGIATASLAKSWETDQKGLNYTFHLQNNVYWHDGKKFTAKDVSYKLKGAAFSAPDDFTLSVKLEKPYSPLPVLLSRPILRPGLIGLGQYKVIKSVYTGDNLTEISLQSLNKSTFLTYRFYPTPNDALLGFKLGEVNILQNISQIDDLSGWKNLKITPITQFDRFVGIFYNLKNTYFKEKEVRQALAYAVPKFADAEAALTPISPLSWAYSKNTRLYKYDPEAAQKILQKAPISSSSTQLTITTYASLLTTAQTIADDWRKIGLDVKVKVVSSIPSDFEILLAAQNIPSDPDQYQMWQSTQEGTNITHYSNLKIDKLLEDGRVEQNLEKRKKIYADFQRYLVDDAPVNFLYYPKVYNVERK